MPLRFSASGAALLLPALAIDGLIGWLVSACVAAALTASWSGIALRIAAASSGGRCSAIDLFVFGRRSRSVAARDGRSGFSCCPVVAYAAPWRCQLQMDWGFLLQKGGVLANLVLCPGPRSLTLCTAPRPGRSLRGAIVVSLAILVSYAAVQGS